VFIRITSSAIGKLLLCVAILLIGAEGLLFASNVHVRHRAESLLHSVRELKLGESKLAEVEPVVSAYGAQQYGSSSSCPAADVGYATRVANDTVDRLGMSHPILYRFGIHPSGVVATFLFEKGRLCSLTFTVSVITHNGSTRQEIWATTTEQPVGALGASHSEYDIAFPLVHGYIKHLSAVITPNTNTGDRARAFGYDLSCLAAFQGCQGLRQILPTVWEDAVTRHRTEGLSIPQDELDGGL